MILMLKAHRAAIRTWEKCSPVLNVPKSHATANPPPPPPPPTPHPPPHPPPHTHTHTPLPLHRLPSQLLPPSPDLFVLFDRTGLTDRSQGCTIIAWYVPGWSAPIFLNQSCLAGQGLRTAWCCDRWRPLIKARRGSKDWCAEIQILKQHLED